MLMMSWCWHRCGRGFLDSYMPKTTEVCIYYLQPGSGQRVSLRKKPGGYTNIAWGYPSHVVLPNNSLYLHFVGDIAQTLHTFIHIHSIRQPAAPPHLLHLQISSTPLMLNELWPKKNQDKYFWPESLSFLGEWSWRKASTQLFSLGCEIHI